MAKEIVVPGELLGMEEEFFGNEKTIAENGNVYSTVMGEKKLLNKQMQVYSPRSARMLRKGDLVVGKVHDLYDSVSLIIIDNLDGRANRFIQRSGEMEMQAGQEEGKNSINSKEGNIPPAMLAEDPFQSKERRAIGATYAYMRITELVRGGGYVKNFRQHIKIGDILKARVIEVNPLGTYLSIAEDGLGVLKARCSSCHLDLAQRGRLLICEECGNKENRKLAIL